MVSFCPDLGGVCAWPLCRLGLPWPWSSTILQRRGWQAQAGWCGVQAPYLIEMTVAAYILFFAPVVQAGLAAAAEAPLHSPVFRFVARAPPFCAGAPVRRCIGALVPCCCAAVLPRCSCLRPCPAFVCLFTPEYPTWEDAAASSTFSSGNLVGSPEFSASNALSSGRRRGRCRVCECAVRWCV